MKTIIIEDEKNTREALKKLLKLLQPSIEIVGESGYVKDAIRLINTKKPELIFLDIQLEDGNAFEILENLEYLNAKIIFTTAYNQYAIKAFKFSAVDYILKPIDPSDLTEAIEKASNQIASEKEHQLLLKNLQQNIDHAKKITIKTSDGTHFIDIDEVVRLEADGSYTNFITQSQQILASKNIKFYQEILNDTFLRCHHSHLVNPKFIVELHRNDLVLSNKETVPVSARKKSEVKALLKNL